MFMPHKNPVYDGLEVWGEVNPGPFAPGPCTELSVCVNDLEERPLIGPGEAGLRHV